MEKLRPEYMIKPIADLTAKELVLRVVTHLGEGIISVEPINGHTIDDMRHVDREYRERFGRSISDKLLHMIQEEKGGKSRMAK